LLGCNVYWGTSMKALLVGIALFGWPPRGARRSGSTRSSTTRCRAAGRLSTLDGRHPAHEDLFVKSSGDAVIHVVFVPAQNGARADTTMLYFHGQSNNVGTSWRASSCSIHWASTWRPSIRAATGARRAPRRRPASTTTCRPCGMRWRRARAGRHEAHHLRPLAGAAFAIDLAAVRTPAALVTESAFASIAAMVRDGAYVDLPPGFVTDARWDNLAKIPRVAAPYLALHGLADDYVRYQYSQELTAAHRAAQPASARSSCSCPAPTRRRARPPPTLGQAAYLELLRNFLGL